MSLTANTKAMLDECMAAGYSLRKIAIESNGTVEYEWLRKAAPDRLEYSITNKVQALHDFLLSLTAQISAAKLRAPQTQTSADPA